MHSPSIIIFVNRSASLGTHPASRRPVTIFGKQWESPAGRPEFYKMLQCGAHLIGSRQCITQVPHSPHAGGQYQTCSH
ncbi:hypothetical protein B0H17DRAFT_1051452 [Mycena rosella]|uniref:Uncharacterized protein n=1 Tax=Mycena rosella TaxID=1033263 RepID=A0AAD7DS48_MYCRO|nr:hypothetical protein B0H17DRAFT_1051452 [Mycena rosella]